MTLQIEEGKYYRTRDGRKVGPMGIWISREIKYYDCESGDIEWSGKIWYPNGNNFQQPEIDLVAEWKDTEEMTHEDTPKMWKDMTDEEKGALLLAHHEGETIEFTGGEGSEANWFEDEPMWLYNLAYRVKPAPKEPKCETVLRYGSTQHGWWLTNKRCSLDTHKITFNLIDGVPDCDTIKMEGL